MKKPRTNGRNHGHPVRRKKSAPGHPVRRKVPRLFRPFSGYLEVVVVVAATGGVGGITGPSRGLTTIYIPGYTGPN